MPFAQGITEFASWGDYWRTSWIIWVSAICVIAVYSYLFKDNALYRAIIQIFIGISIGYGIIINWVDYLWPMWWLPMLDGFNALLFHKPGSPWGAMWALVGLLGLLWYFQLSRKYLYLSRFVIGLTVGIGAGLTFQSQIGQNMPQVVDSFRPLAPSVVGPAPLQRFTLPPSVVPPVLVDPVVYVAQSNQVQCVEVLGGVVVWSAALPAPPTSALRQDGDDLIVPISGRDLHFDRYTGANKPDAPTADGTMIAVLDAGDKKIEVHRGEAKGFAEALDFGGLAATSACVMKKVVDDKGKERDLVFIAIGGKPKAFEAPSGKVVWTGDTQATADAVYDGGRTLCAVTDGVLKFLDPNTGQLQKSVRAGAPVGFVSAAHMSEPTQDLIMAILPLNGTAVAAAMAKDDGATKRNSGELLWKKETHKPIIWTATLDGVMLVDGPQGGACYEIPYVQTRLVAQDYTDNWIFIVALLSVMTYFFFSFKQSNSKSVSQFSRIGRWTLMIGFGAIFGNTVMTRMSFLLDRLQFLHDEWLMPLWHHLLRSLGLG